MLHLIDAQLSFQNIFTVEFKLLSFNRYSFLTAKTVQIQIKTLQIFLDLFFCHFYFIYIGGFQRESTQKKLDYMLNENSIFATKIRKSIFTHHVFCFAFSNQIAQMANAQKKLMDKVVCCSGGSPLAHNMNMQNPYDHQHTQVILSNVNNKMLMTSR